MAEREKLLRNKESNHFMILYKDGETKFSYFINHKGLRDEGHLEMISDQGIVSLKSSDGNWYEYPIFLESQIECSLERGGGTLTWPDKEGRPYGEMDLDILLSLDKEKISKDLTNIGMDDNSINDILSLIRSYKNDFIKSYEKIRPRRTSTK